MVVSARSTVLVGVMLLSACRPTPGPTTVPPTSPPGSPTAPPALPTPTLAAEISSPQIVLRDDGVVEAIGVITNRSTTVVGGLRLEIRFAGAGGQPLARAEVPPSLPWLPAGASTPYRAVYAGPGMPTAAEAQVVAYQQRQAPSIELDVTVEDEVRTADGGWRVIGAIRGDSRQAALLQGFALGAFEDDRLVGLSLPPAAPTWIPADSDLPFEANFLQPLDAPEIRRFWAAEPAQGQPGPRLVAELLPEIQRDDLGDPFVVGWLHNPANAPLAPRVLLVVRTGGLVVRVLELRTSIPLAPGEARAFALRLPEPATSADPADLAVSPWVEDRRPPAGSRPRPLTAQITSAERIGGSYFLRGTVRNPSPGQVQDPTVFVALRSTAGDLWSAHWQLLAAELPGEAEVEFVLSLTLPQAAHVEAGEFDLRALGLDLGGG